MTLKSQGMDDNCSAIQEVQEMMAEQEKQQLSKLKVNQSKYVEHGTSCVQG